MPRPFLITETMVRLSDIQEAFLPLVGWEQSYNPQNQIDEELCKSESGLTYQGAHPLLTLENIRNIMPDDYMYRYPQWSIVRIYRRGDKVQHGGKIWIAKRANKGSEPHITDFNADYNYDYNAAITRGGDYNEDYNEDFFKAADDDWILYNMMSDYVRRLTINGINTTVQNFLIGKMQARETRSLLERRALFDNAARLESFVQPSGRLVGLEIVPVRAMGVTTKIERIGLQMRGAVGEITLYLFHSSQVEPIRTIVLEYTNTSGAFQWFTPKEEVYLPYKGENTDAGGAWYLCYNQNALPFGMRALSVTKDWSKEPCATCLGYALESWKQITKYLQISPFCVNVDEGFAEAPALFDTGRLMYTQTCNYGINLEVSIGCDLTDFLISQRHIFANVLQKQVAANVLRTIAMNPDVRVNRNQMNATREELLYEIDGVAQGRPTGLAYDLQQAYKALRIDTQGLDRICLQCNNNGVAYSHV